MSNKLEKGKSGNKFGWSSDTIDNEHLGRRSSKCCFVYEKQRAFGESSSESEKEYEETDIYTEYLTETDKNNIQKGIYVNGKQNLNQLIEDFE